MTTPETTKACPYPLPHGPHNWSFELGAAPYQCPGVQPVMTTPKTETDPTAREVGRATMRLLDLEAGRWAVKVRASANDELDELHVEGILSVRVYAVLDRETLTAHGDSTVVQLAAKRLADPFRFALVEASGAEAEAAERMRRLHEEATERAAALRTALEAIVREWDDNYDTGDYGPLGTLIEQAREVLS